MRSQSTKRPAPAALKPARTTHAKRPELPANWLQPDGFRREAGGRRGLQAAPSADLRVAQLQADTAPPRPSRGLMARMLGKKPPQPSTLELIAEQNKEIQRLDAQLAIFEEEMEAHKKRFAHCWLQRNILGLAEVKRAMLNCQASMARMQTCKCKALDLSNALQLSSFAQASDAREKRVISHLESLTRNLDVAEHDEAVRVALATTQDNNRLAVQHHTPQAQVNNDSWMVQMAKELNLPTEASPPSVADPVAMAAWDLPPPLSQPAAPAAARVQAAQLGDLCLN